MKAVDWPQTTFELVNVWLSTKGPNRTLGGPLETVDLAQPAGQWVPSGENLGHHSGYSYLFAYTLAQSKDTRSFDPVFTVVGTADAQSASSTPFDIFNRGLNFAPSDFDRTHVIQGQWVLELPFGRGRRWDAGRWANAVIGGWQVAGQVLVVSGQGEGAERVRERAFR